MNSRQKLAVTISLLFMASALASLPLSTGAPTAGNMPSPAPSGIFNGNVTILADGHVSANAPVKQNGNYYNLTGSINGTLTIEHNGTVFNGMGYNVSYSGSVPANVTANLSGTHGVTLSNVNINATFSEVGIYLANSNNENIVNVNVEAMGAAVFAANHTSDINISDSQFTGSGLANAPGLVMIGVYPSGGLGVNPSSSADNFSIYNDSFETSFQIGDVLLGATNSSVTDSSFNATDTYFTLLLGGNNTVVKGNTFTGFNLEGTFSASPNYNGQLENLIFSNNVVNATTPELGNQIISLSASGII